MGLRLFGWLSGNVGRSSVVRGFYNGVAQTGHYTRDNFQFSDTYSAFRENDRRKVRVDLPLNLPGEARISVHPSDDPSTIEELAEVVARFGTIDTILKTRGYILENYRLEGPLGDSFSFDYEKTIHAQEEAHEVFAAADAALVGDLAIVVSA